MYDGYAIILDWLWVPGAGTTVSVDDSGHWVMQTVWFGMRIPLVWTQYKTGYALYWSIPHPLPNNQD